MESTKSFEARWQRILACSGAKTDSSLARILEILPQSVTAARKRQQIPSGWIENIADKFEISADWLLFGRGPMRPEASAVPSADAPLHAPLHAPLPTPQPMPARQGETCTPCPRCPNLDTRLQEMEGERRELTTEIRQLWRENATLREENATLRERQYQKADRSGGEAVGGIGA